MVEPEENVPDEHVEPDEDEIDLADNVDDLELPTIDVEDTFDDVDSADDDLVLEEPEEEEPEEEDYFDEEVEDEEEEDDDGEWAGRGRKKPKPGRQVKPPKQKKPKRGKGAAPDCKKDIDHIIDCQLGGDQECPEVCKNLIPVNSSVNQSIGPTMADQLKGKAGQFLEKVTFSPERCKRHAPRTRSCI